MIQQLSVCNGYYVLVIKKLYLAFEKVYHWSLIGRNFWKEFSFFHCTFNLQMQHP